MKKDYCFLDKFRIVCSAFSVFAIGLILWFDCTHKLWVFSECSSVQRILVESFSLSNIDHWFRFVIPIFLANIGVYFRLKCFGLWYDYFYIFQCLLGIFMSALVLTIEIPWDGVIYTFENEHPYEFLYIFSVLLTILLVLPMDLILWAIALYKRMLKPTTNFTQ